MSTEAIALIHATMPQYFAGASDMTMRSRLLLRRIRDRGRLELNQGGDEQSHQVEFSQPEISQHGDGGVLDFSAHDAFRRITLDWRGYIGTDALTMKQKAMNKGPWALINLYSTKTDRLMKSIKDKFCGELYKDGSATGRENSIHGLETVLAKGTVAAGDILAQPNDTYGTNSLSTAVGNQGGSWTSSLSTSPNATIATDWPNGNGDSSYDFLSPKLINWSSTGWGTGSTTWEDNCERAISQGITWLSTTGGEDGMPDVCVLTSHLFQGYKNHQAAKQRIIIPHQGANDLGFPMALNQDGCAVLPDFDCPVNTGYLLRTNDITISSLMPDLFWSEGPDKDPRTAWSYMWGVGFYGNTKLRPKFIGKLSNYA